METNPVVDKLPKHLLDFVIDQNYNSYTPVDQAVWRYVMRQNLNYLPKVATESYLEGIEKTGISIDSIPDMYGMNRILKDIGWAAVAVDGFIPPAAFMEFQAYNVLVIAADIRPLNQIAYTPAPDIIHEAAGHAPIIANPVYADYLKVFGEVGSKAFSSAKDYEIYEAIRHLSILKADPNTNEEDILKAENDLKKFEENPEEPSEMSLIRNLHWWTVEYGLIGELDNPKIYGAGLLSSIGESYHCLQDTVKKIPYNIEAAKIGFDITKPQPQLFVTPDFKTLIDVLDEFANTMALRKGGLYGIKKAIESNNTATVEYSSGIQVSGTFTGVTEKDGNPVYLNTTGPTNLAFANKELLNHSKKYHNEGFGSPIGKLKGINTAPEDLSEQLLIDYGYIKGQKIKLEFNSGVIVEGVLDSILHRNSKLIMLSFSDCHVSFNGKDLFLPEWGMYDMAVGSEIISAFSGPADSEAFELKYDPPKEKTHKISYSEEDLKLHAIYEEIRNIREGNCSFALLPYLWDKLRNEHPEDWLVGLEILELLSFKKIKDDFSNEVTEFLHAKLKENKVMEKLITDGISLIKD